MAYSVMVWLVNPGVHPQQEDEQVRLVDGNESAPGAASGVNMGYAIPRIVYGVYESQDEADGALSEVSSQDRKSTRLNSSHANISYAVFCLKKTIPTACRPPRRGTRLSCTAGPKCSRANRVATLRKVI